MVPAKEEKQELTHPTPRLSSHRDDGVRVPRGPSSKEANGGVDVEVEHAHVLGNPILRTCVPLLDYVGQVDTFRRILTRFKKQNAPSDRDDC